MKHDEIQIGMIQKSAQVSTLPVSEKELVEINKLTLEPLAAEDVFTFKVAMCDNEVDRTFEAFPIASLQTMKDLFVGKTMIKDHLRSADNQVARIYATEIVTGEGTAKTGEPFTQLVAHCYMLDNDANKGLIAEIKGGIKKEVSVGLSVSKAICSVCGRDNVKSYCEHFWGKEYDGQLCFFTLEEPSDAYELSFVAVPAQAQAGTIKALEEKKKAAQPAEPVEPETTEKTDTEATELNLRFKSLGAFLYASNQQTEGENVNE